MFSSLLGKYIGVELPSHGVYLAMKGTSKLFSEVVEPFCIPSSNRGEFQFLHILAHTCYVPVFLILVFCWVCSGISMWFQLAFPWWQMMLRALTHAYRPFLLVCGLACFDQGILQLGEVKSIVLSKSSICFLLIFIF